MAKMTIVRKDQAPLDERAKEAVKRFLFGVVDGFSNDDKRAWRKFWRRLSELEPGEMAVAEMVFPRSGPFHRRHMKIEQTVFDAQERFTNFEQFRVWLKIGAGWVDWCAGPKGGVVPVPRSISYAKADQAVFEQFHKQVMEFLRGPHAAPFLWRHLGGKADEMMETILREFE